MIEDNAPFAKKHNQKLPNFLKAFGPALERPEAEFFLLLPLVNTLKADFLRTADGGFMGSSGKH